MGLFPCPTAYGSLYGDRTFRPTPPPAGPFPVVIDFTFPGPELLTDPDPATDTITIVNAGDYEITYDIQLINQSSGSANNTFTVQRGGPVFTDILESTAELVSDDFISAIGRTVQVTLNEGEQIRLAIIGSDGNHQYYLPALTVKRIDC